MDFLAFTIEIALEAGEILCHYYGGDFKIETKSNYRDTVTQADKESEIFLVNKIREKFPDHLIVGEEGADDRLPITDYKYRWIIDPLDGTTNFTKSIPVFAISIALEKEGELFVGVIYNPITNQMWFGEKGQGAYLAWDRSGKLENLEKVQKIGKKLQVSAISELKYAVLSTGFIPSNRSHYEKNMSFFGEFGAKGKALRRMGAAAIDLAYVASGWLDGHWEYDLNSWDIAAGTLLVREAGGRVSNFNGSPLDLDGGKILASNGLIHQEMMGILGSD